MSEFLSEVHALLLEQGLGKARVSILAKQLEKHGGKVIRTLTESTTHILVGNKTKLGRVPILLKVNSIPETVSVLRADWLSACLTKREVVPENSYRVLPELSPPVKEQGAVTQASPSKAAAKSTTRERDDEVPKNEVTSDGGGGSLGLLSPKAGMFSVAPRRWKTSPVKSKIASKGELDSDSDYVESEEEQTEEKEGMKEHKELDDIPHGAGSSLDVGDRDGMQDETALPPKKKRRWICEIGSSTAQTWVNHNKHITDKLEELLTVYKNNGEKWRAMSTTKVIQAVKKHPKEITTLEEAQSVPFVGKRLAEKIFEIVSSGKLRRLENVDKERERVIEMFKNIHGVGQVIAQQFYAQGYRSLQDLKDANVLNRVQSIGVKYFDEFLERMQREEVAEIEAKVKEIAHSINDGLEVVTCGSYRRGKPTCGDVDILITHPDGRSYRGIFGTFLEKAHEDGFLTDDLSVHNEPNGSSKYLGVCKLEGEGRKHRRIDIMVVPYCEFPLALLHFTGSGHMNRSMRSKADKMGMSLSEHALCTGVIRKNGVKIFEGTPLPVTCEEDVFKYLGLEYKDPKDRDWD